jgi:two-component system, chemotaxis family, protein-glutamate methylesterase/glutaminase
MGLRSGKISEGGLPGWKCWIGSAERVGAVKEIRIIVATPSAIDRSRLERALSASSWVKIIAQTSDLSETFTAVEALEPDIVLLAQAYTELPEFDCMRSLFSAVDARWIGLDGPGVYSSRAENPARAPRAAMPSGAVNCLEDLLERMHELGAQRRSKGGGARKTVEPAAALRTNKFVLIGASTGGIDALLTVLANFPKDCPPTAIVQHTGKGFSESLVRLFDKRCAAKVVEAQDGLVLERGMICVAAGVAGHLRLHPGKGLRCSLQPGPMISGQIPAIDALFRSAVPLAPRVIAVLLTGMGNDGAVGMLDLQRAGAMTIGQDERTSVVYGMPRVAFELGAVRQQLALDRIGAEIIKLADSAGNTSFAERQANG